MIVFISYQEWLILLPGRIKEFTKTKKLISGLILFSFFCYTSTAPHRFTVRGGIPCFKWDRTG